MKFLGDGIKSSFNDVQCPNTWYWIDSVDDGIDTCFNSEQSLNA